MFFKGEYIKDEDITRMNYNDKGSYAMISRIHVSAPCMEIDISCTRNEYEIEAMHLERRMERR